MNRTDRDHLSDALAHIEAIHRHLARAGLDDSTVADAVSLRLAAAIDAAGRLQEARRHPARAFTLPVSIGSAADDGPNRRNVGMLLASSGC